MNASLHMLVPAGRTKINHVSTRNIGYCVHKCGHEYANGPEYNAVKIKRVLNDACGWHADSKYILKGRQVIDIGNLLYAVQVTTYINSINS